MPEKISLRNWTNDMHFAIAAIVLAKAAGDKIERRDDNCLEVSLLINGVEVPFSATICEWFDRINETVDERAAKIAYAKMSVDALFAEVEKIHETIRKADWQIREAVEKAFGVTLPED